MKLMRLRLVALSLCFCSLAGPADVRAEEPDLKAVVATLEEGYHLLRDLQADFAQKTTIATVKREERGHGELLLRMPLDSAAMFRFDYKKPKQQIVSDGRQLWFYIPENRQVMVSDLKTMLAQGGVALNYLTGLGNVSRDFAITFAGSGRDAKGNYLLELLPKKGGQAFSKLHLAISAQAVAKYRENGIAQEPFPIVASVVFDQLGNRTSIDYSRVRVNQGLAASRFVFKVPAGVDIIRQ